MGKLPRTIKVSPQSSGRTNKVIDYSKRSMKPGKRLSKSGKLYTEKRPNRSDKNPALRW